jgi:hypothetical protein
VSLSAGLGGSFIDKVEAIVARIEKSPAQFPAWPGDPRFQKAVLPETFPWVVGILGHDVFNERSGTVVGGGWIGPSRSRVGTFSTSAKNIGARRNPKSEMHLREHAQQHGRAALRLAPRVALFGGFALAS